jgi:ribosomal protein S18 acetylase RimI-like enzyme
MRHVSPSLVRPAKPTDHQEVWRLFLQGHRENGIFKLCPEKVDFFLQRALQPSLIPETDTGPRGQIVVIGPPGALEAVCFVIIGEFWYSKDKHIEELLVYVDPEARNSGHAKALIEWMKKTADALGVRVLSGIMSNTRTEAKVRLYKRHMPCIGSFFLYPNQ